MNGVDDALVDGGREGAREEDSLNKAGRHFWVGIERRHRPTLTRRKRLVRTVRYATDSLYRWAGAQCALQPATIVVRAPIVRDGRRCVKTDKHTNSQTNRVVWVHCFKNELKSPCSKGRVFLLSHEQA